MRIETRWFDVGEATPQTPPSVWFPRRDDDVWHVPWRPVRLDQTIEWGVVRTGRQVKINLVPYTIVDDPAGVAAFCLGLGARVLADFSTRPKVLYILAARPCTEVHIPGGPDGELRTALRAYMNVALIF